MIYQHRFRVQAPVQAVADFHSYPDAMAVITPPPIFVQVHQRAAARGRRPAHGLHHVAGAAAAALAGPLRGRDPHQLRRSHGAGAAADLEHRHSFVAVDDDHTDVVDELEVAVRRHPLWGPVGLGMSLNLPVLFAYRQWQTRRLLEQQRQTGAPLTALMQQAGKSQANVTLALGAVALAVGAVAGIAVLKRARRARQPQPFSRNGTS